MTTYEELRKKIEEQQSREIKIDMGTQKGSTLIDTLNIEFQKVVMPSWILLIFLESSLVSVLLGIALLFGDPMILIFGGLLQGIPSSYILLKRVYKVTHASNK